MVRVTRREFLAAGSVAWLAGSTFPLAARADESAAEAAQRSPLIYVSPLRSDGAESRCHAEVWFVADGADLLVVTAADRWRARAIRAGLSRARVWIGDHGVWTVSEERYRSSPSIDVEGAIDGDPAHHAAALERFGQKYAAQWSSWGPRFERGLADGSRVLLRYRPVTAG